MENNTFYLTKEAVKILVIFYSFDKKFELEKKIPKCCENIAIKKFYS